jgi:single-strand DNA-binding protein
VDRRFKSENGPTADFPNCVAFGKTAEFIEKYFHKGMKIGLQGRIQTGSYTNNEGQKVYTTDVVVESCEFVESKSAQQSSQDAGGLNQADNDGFMNVPEGIDEELPF